MIDKGSIDPDLLRKIKDFSWWTFYSLFLLVVLLLLYLMMKSLLGGALGRISNFGEVIYLFGLVLAVIGLMGLCVAYIVKVMRYRLKTRLRTDSGGPGNK
jgi:cation transporter-like permease